MIKQQSRSERYQDIIESYKLSINYSNLSESKHWLKKNEPKRAKFFNFLQENIHSLENFRKDKFLSKGLDDAVDPRNIPNAFFNLAKAHGGDRSLKFFQQNNIGNSDKCIFLFEKYIDFHEIFLVDYVIKLEDYFFSQIKDPIICEIGGGYGALARMIIDNHKCKYILIDLPETNVLSSYYLGEHFYGNKRILHFSELNKPFLAPEDIKDFDIIIIPPNINFYSDLKVDLFINTRSFMEMNLSTVESYFNLIQSSLNIGGCFLNINRYHKSTTNEDNMIARYPYDDCWDAIISEKAFMQDWIHLLLSKRTTAPNKEFRKILIDLEVESKKYVHSRIKKYFHNFIGLILRMIPAPLKSFLKKLATTKIP